MNDELLFSRGRSCAQAKGLIGAAAESFAAEWVKGYREGASEGVRAERERCRAVVRSPHADGRAAMARHLAFETGVCVEEAEAMLRLSPVDPAYANALVTEATLVHREAGGEGK